MDSPIKIKPSMIDIEVYKKKLGEAGKKLSEPEIQKLLNLHYGLANTFFGLWLKKDNVVMSKGTIIRHDRDGNFISIFAYQFLYVSR